MEDNSLILDRIREQLDTAKDEFAAARTELENIIECFITDVRDNMEFYVNNNIKREIKKSPHTADNVNEEKAAAMAAELKEALASFMETALPALRDFRGWRNEDTVYIDTKSKLWHSVKSVEDPTNRILKKYGLNPITLKNWTWLSMETNEMITTRFSESKKKFLDKRKQFKYLSKRYEEETKIENVFDKLDNI